MRPRLKNDNRTTHSEELQSNRTKRATESVANSTSASFTTQKLFGDGPKLVRELLRVADDDTKRCGAHSWGLERLNQLGGFDSRGDAKLILDPASPWGRIERKIALPRPLSDIKARRSIFQSVANSTSASFTTQKLFGDGPKLVRELLRVADDDTKRCGARSWGLERLNQLGGFDSRGDAKLILDPASPRGRIERKIALPRPLSDTKARRRIFQIHASRMALAMDVNLEKFVWSEDDFSGADVKAIFTEAGLIAYRDLRIKTIQADFEEAKDKVMSNKEKGVPEAFIKFNGFFSFFKFFFFFFFVCKIGALADF